MAAIVGPLHSLRDARLECTIVATSPGDAAGPQSRRLRVVARSSQGHSDRICLGPPSRYPQDGGFSRRSRRRPPAATSVRPIVGIRMPCRAFSSGLLLALSIQRHSFTNEVLQRIFVDLVFFLDVDGPPDLPVEAGVESGSASLMIPRTLPSVVPRQSPRSLILSSLSLEALVLSAAIWIPLLQASRPVSQRRREAKMLVLLPSTRPPRRRSIIRRKPIPSEIQASASGSRSGRTPPASCARRRTPAM